MEKQGEFYRFISEVVHNEMDENQQSIFELEGQEIIETLFQYQTTYEEEKESIGLDFGLGVNDIGELAKSVISVGPFIISVFTLYLTYKRDKRSEKSDELKILKEEWKSQLVLDGKVDPNTAELIVNKYSTQLLQLSQ